MSALVRHVLCCVVLLGSLASAPVRAQTDEDHAARARALFEQGNAQADAAHWTEAAALFEQALALRDSPVIRFNLASALLELDHLVKASEQLREILADERATPELKQRAQQSLDALTPRLASLTVRVAEPSGARVLLDDEELAPAQLDVPLPVDPKLHYLSLRLGERVLDDRQVELAEGDAREVRLAAAPEPVVAQKPVAPLELQLLGLPRDGHTSKRRRRIAIGVSVAAAVAAGVVAGVLVARKDDDGGSASDFSPGRLGIRVPQ